MNYMTAVLRSCSYSVWSKKVTRHVLIGIWFATSWSWFILAPWKIWLQGGGAAGVGELANQTLDGEEFLKRRNDVSKSINVKKASSCCRIQSNFFVKKTIKVGKKFQSGLRSYRSWARMKVILRQTFHDLLYVNQNLGARSSGATSNKIKLNMFGSKLV